MSKIISEENPAAQQSAQQSTAPQGQGAGGAQDKVRKQARQLAYDVRYKVKQGFKDGQKTDPASLKRAFLSQLGKSHLLQVLLSNLQRRCLLVKLMIL